MPLVSVIIPTRNRAGLLRQAIESVLASCNQLLQAEIIVVDDGSTDETAAVARSYPVTYLLGPARGVSSARNIGLNQATGQYITFLDDDDAWPAHNLTAQIKLLEENPQLGAVCSQVMLTDASGHPCSPPYPNPPFRSGWMFNDFLDYIPQVGSLLVRREVIQAVGGFEPELHGGEDWDWALRIARHYQIGFVPTVGLLWRMHDTSRVDGAGNRRVEDITWRRYTDVMRVARRYLVSSSPRGWLKNQRILLKHKGHYIPLFLSYAASLMRTGRIIRAGRCYWLAARVSLFHIASYSAKTLLRHTRYG